MPLFRRKTAPSDRPNKQTPSGSGLVRTPSNRSNKSSSSLPLTPGTPDSWGDDGKGYANGFIPGQKRPATLVLSEAIFQDQANISVESLESPLRTSSRLSKTLLEVVRDHNALACLRAFLRSQRADHLVQFWCDAESFHAATLTRMRTHSLHSSQAGRRRRTESSSSAASERAESLKGVEAPSSAASSCVSSPIGGNSSVTLPLGVKPSFSSGGNLIIPGDNVPSLHGVNQREQCLSTHIPNVEPRSNETASSQSDQQRVDYSKTNNPGQSFSNDTSPNKDTQNGPVGPDECSKISTDSANSCVESLASDNTISGSDKQTPEEPVTNKSPHLDPSSSQCDSSSDQQPDDLVHKLEKSIERDAVNIFSKYIAKDAPHPIDVGDELRSEVISKICQVNGKVDPESFVNCQRFVLSRIESEYFPAFRDSAFHCRHQVHVLTTERVFLPDVLLNENALCYFMEYMEQESVSDLMQVWLCATNFQEQLEASGPGYDPMQAQSDAMVIYDKYFSLQATNPVGFDDKLRFEIEGNICREEGPLPDCFTKAKNIVLKMLEKTFFPSYLSSQIYHRYLSDLISTVQMDEDFPQRPGGVAMTTSASQSFKGHRRSESDASSEHSFSSNVSQPGEASGGPSARNTLLAVDTRRTHKRPAGGAREKGGKINIEGADFSMNLDMFNPDDLWKRPQANKLSLGSVNQLGQFVSDFEHETSDRRRTSLGPALFKRRKDKEKEEEEMALRIAQIIISDVNTMTQTGETMANSKSSS